MQNPAKLVHVSVYTDGSASFKSGTGGWAFVAIKGSEVAEIYGFSDKTTIGEMELTAIHEAFKWLPLGPSPIRVFCDSQYAVNCLNVWGANWAERNWFAGQGKRPCHWRLIKAMLEAIEVHRRRRSVSIIWLPGHSKHRHNERADVLCGKARKEQICNV